MKIHPHQIFSKKIRKNLKKFWKPIDKSRNLWYNIVTVKGKTKIPEQRKRERKMKNINTKLYLEFIKNAIATDGYKVADAANKIALEKGAITAEQYLDATHLIVNAFLA